MRKIHKISISLLLVSMLITPIYAADITQISDNTIRIGNDFYDFTSSNFTNENILKSLESGNVAYVKLGGFWYNIFLLDGSQIADANYAEPEQEVNSWTGLGTWYKQGEELEDVVDEDSSSGVSGTYAIADNNAFTKKFSVSLNGEVEGFNYYNVLNEGVTLSNSNVSIDGYITNVTTVFEDISKLTVEFYSDSDGQNKVAEATLEEDGSLVVTIEGQDSEDSNLEEFEVISID